MKISNEILVSMGMDPKIYSENDREKINIYIDEIQNGNLIKLIDNNSMPLNAVEPLGIEHKNNFIKLRSVLNKISDNANKLMEIFSIKSSVFASEFSLNEKALVLSKSSDIIQESSALCEKIDEISNSFFQGINILMDYQSECNYKLENLGMINLAAKVYNCENDYIEKIENKIEDSFNFLNNLTAFINDLNNKTVICETVTDKGIRILLNNITKYADFENDGQSINSVKVLDECKKIKYVVKNVLDNQNKDG